MSGRIDVHSHIIPGVDDGCKTLEESMQCARMLVEAGYCRSFCTPHVWPNRASVTMENVGRWTRALQEEFNRAGIDLKLSPGGELNLHANVMNLPAEQIIPMALGNRYILTDLWAEKLPEFFAPAVRWLQGMGLTVILAHPERCRAVQDDPGLADVFAEMGILLQGNLQCLSDRPEADTRRVAEKFLTERRYFLLGTDLHAPHSLGRRLDGLKTAIKLVGEEVVAKLTVENPNRLLG